MDSDRIFNREPSREDEAPAFRRARVVPPAGWLVGAVLLLAAAGIVGWGLVGTVTRSVAITGIVFPQSGIREVHSQVEGVLSYVQVEVGDMVQAGDLIAIIPQKELLEQIDLSRQSQAPQEELDRLYAAYQSASMIYTPVSGRVVDLAQEGEAIQVGDLVVGVTSANDAANEEEIRAYVTAETAQSIKKGMEVRVYPSTSASEEYGYVQGLISDISSYPITEADISDALGRFYTGEIVPQDENILEVRVTLLAGAEEAAGTWSRAEGGSLSIDTGTLCRMQVVVSEMTAWEYLRS